MVRANITFMTDINKNTCSQTHNLEQFVPMLANLTKTNTALAL